MNIMNQEEYIKRRSRSDNAFPIIIEMLQRITKRSFRIGDDEQDCKHNIDLISDTGKTYAVRIVFDDYVKFWKTLTIRDRMDKEYKTEMTKLLNNPPDFYFSCFIKDGELVSWTLYDAHRISNGIPDGSISWTKNHSDCKFYILSNLEQCIIYQMPLTKKYSLEIEGNWTAI